jgi:hypothetical protein
LFNEPFIHLDELQANNSSNNNNNSHIDKPASIKFPEPYAIIIVKAILSREDNVMQLKDIYNYFKTK